MAEFSIDRFVDLYAHRTSGMSASEVRALFAVASRPDVVSLAGGMPFVQALPTDDVLDVVRGRPRRARRRCRCSTAGVRGTSDCASDSPD